MSKKHKEHHEEHVDETWLIPYADLLTLLLALFIVLFATSQTDAKKFEQQLQAFSTAFKEGLGILSQNSNRTGPIQTPDINSKNPDNNKENKAEQDEKTKQNQEQIEKEKEKAKQKQEMMNKESEELKELQKKLDAYIKDNHLTTELETKLTDDMLSITIRDRALFASGSAVVKTESQKLAYAISDMLVKYDQYEIIVAGHTDNQPISTSEFRSNWDLSTKRSLNFMNLLFQNKNIHQQKYSAVGFGEYRPIATNDSAEGRAENRRVEISIMRKFKESSNQILSTTP